MAEPMKLIAGDKDRGFFGMVESSEFMTGEQLCSDIGLTAGVLQHSNTPWLKFSYKGKILYTPLKPIRHSISWNNINAINGVYGDSNAPIVMDNSGNEYSVRLFKGAFTNPSKNGDSDRGAIGSEWNDLLLPVHINASTGNWNHPQCVEPDLPDWEIGLTNEDFTVDTHSWCQETVESDSSRRVLRGFNSIEMSSWTTPTENGVSRSYRPVLERNPRPDELITVKHLIKSQNKIHTLLEDTLAYPNLITPTQEQFEQFGMDALEGYENQISKVAHEMNEDGVLEDGRVIRKIVNKNEFKINSLGVR